MPKPAQTPAARTFNAALERSQSRLQWVIARIPFDVAELWGKRGSIRVMGYINGFPFRTSLFPTGDGSHVLLVNKKMQAGAKAGPGETARFRLEPETEKRVVAIPPELERALSEDRALRRWFDQLSPSARTYMCSVVENVKSDEARERRACQVAEQMLATKEAERELPPVLRLAFARDPGAFKGWQKMPPSHRRHHLLGLFSYRTPEAQARRIAKLVQDSYEYAKK
jgi:uncharacterized protein YdeI (YjbR/CyaY-like superfamily)